MTGGSSKRETLVIWGDTVPTGQTEVRPKAEIQRLLATSRPELLKQAASAYLGAAEAVGNAATAIQDNAGKIIAIWKGPDADRARTALQLVYISGRELAKKLAEMGRCLEVYAGYVPVAVAEVEGIKVDGNDPQVQETVRLNRALYGAEREGDAIALVENLRAQAALRGLNEKIRDLHLGAFPFTITYELPSVTVSDGPGAPAAVDYGGTSGNAGSSSAHGDPAGGGATSGVTAAGGTPAGEGEGGGGGEGEPPGGPDDVRPADGGEAGTPPADQSANGDQPGSQDAAGRPSGDRPEDDGTTPPVIGAQDRPGLDDTTSDADLGPGRTETSAYQPAIGLTHPGTAAPPSPPVTAPDVPSVIGSPGTSYTPGGPLVPGRAGSTTGLSGTPYLPMTGGAGPVGDEARDLERTTYLSEDRTSWSGSHEVTDPVIG